MHEINFILYVLGGYNKRLGEFRITKNVTLTINSIYRSAVLVISNE